MMAGLRRSAAACKAATSSTARKALSFLWKADAGALQFPLDEGVAVEPVGGVKGKEAGHADDDRPQDLVPDVEVVVGEAAPLVRQDAVVGVLGGILRYADAEGAALFHALEDEVDAVGPTLLQAAQCGQDVILFAEAFLGPLHGDFVIAGEGLHPVAVIVGALAEHFFAHHRDAQDLADEMDHLFGPGQAAEVAVDDDAVEAVVYKSEQIAEQPGEEFHRNLLYTGGGNQWAGKPSNAGRASGTSMARTSISPTRSITSSVAPPNTMGAS